MCVLETLRCFFSYFFTTPPLLSTLTGIVVSEDWMAGMFRGASTVSTPSGDRVEVTFSMLAVVGRLEGSDQYNTVRLEVKESSPVRAPVLMDKASPLPGYFN